MALSQVNAPIRQKDKESTMDKILKGMKIANLAVGAGLAIPKWLQEKDLAEEGMEIKRQQADVDFASKLQRTPAPFDTGITGKSADTGEVIEDKPPLGVEISGKEGTYVPIPSDSGKVNKFQAMIDERKGRGFETVVVKDPAGVEKVMTVPADQVDANKHRVINTGIEFEGQIKQSGLERGIGQFGFTQTKDTREDFQATFGNVKKEWKAAKKELAPDLRNLETARAMLRDPNRVTAGAVKGFIVRYVAAEKGVLTDKDIARTIPGSAPEVIADFIRWIRGSEDNVVPEEIIGAMRNAAGTVEDLVRKHMAFNAFDALAEEAAAQPGFFSDGRIKNWEQAVEVQVPGFRSAANIRKLQLLQLNEPDENVDAQYQQRIDAILELEGWDV